VYLSQVLQRDAMTIAIEAQRRNMPRCMGSLFWQYNDCWPVTSWSVQDYFGRKKLAWYGLKRLYEPILVSIQETTDSIFVWITNETAQDFEKRLNVTWNNFEGKEFSKVDNYVKIRANSSVIQWRTSKKDLFGQLPSNEGMMIASVYSREKPRNNESGLATAVFGKMIDLKLPEDQMKISFVRYIQEGPQMFTVRSKVYERQVMFTCDDPTATFSDNGFDLLANVTYTIEVKSASNSGLVEKTLRATTMNRLVNEARASEQE